MSIVSGSTFVATRGTPLSKGLVLLGEHSANTCSGKVLGDNRLHCTEVKGHCGAEDNQKYVVTGTCFCPVMTIATVDHKSTIFAFGVFTIVSLNKAADSCVRIACYDLLGWMRSIMSDDGQAVREDV